MRQRLSIAMLSAVLFLSGWGGVFASAMCRGTEASGTAAADIEESHACCRMQAKESASSSASSSSHCPLAETVAPEQKAPAASADDVSADASAGAGGRFAESSADGCAHCFVRSENPPARFALPEPHARKRADAPHVPRPDRLADAPVVASYARPRFSRGGAPPGTATPRHVLHSVFLI
ncbi:MAG TPA: hypothetical protein VGV59_15885 [Pyrinomonadaceae bacterium]|nr:hypothetical protein [Pyrinomonadaceae bacterium]